MSLTLRRRRFDAEDDPVAQRRLLQLLDGRWSLPLLTALGVGWFSMIGWYCDAAETQASSVAGFSRPLRELLQADLELHRAGVLRYAADHGTLPASLADAAPYMPRIESLVDWQFERFLASCEAHHRPEVCAREASLTVLREPWYVPKSSQAQERAGTSVPRPAVELSVLGLPLLYRRGRADTLPTGEGWLRSDAPWSHEVLEFLEQSGGVPSSRGQSFALMGLDDRPLLASIGRLESRARRSTSLLYGGTLLVVLAAANVLCLMPRRAIRAAVLTSAIAGTLAYFSVERLFLPRTVYINWSKPGTESVTVKERRALLDEALATGSFDGTQIAQSLSWLRTRSAAE